MHILLIHQAFVSPQEAGGTRHFEFARYAVQEGHRFTIISSNLNYITGKKIFKRESLVHKEVIDGVNILRTYTYPSLHRSYFWRVISFLSFMTTSILTAVRLDDIDIVMGTSPPISQALSSWVVSFLKHRPFLLEIRDLWPDFAIDIGILRNPFLIKLLRWLEIFLYKRATHIVVNSPAYRDYLINNKGVPADKITIIPNGVDPSMFINRIDPDLKKKLNLDDKFVVTYAGALGLANDIPTILHAAARLRDLDYIHFLIVGDGKEKRNLEALSKELKLTNVTFLGAFPKTRMPEILSISDVCVATLKNIPMFRMTYPNKVFDYMAAGCPVILAIDGVIREVVEAAGAGIFVPPGDDKALAETVVYLVNHTEEIKQMGERGRNYVAKHFNRIEQVKELINTMESMIKSV